MKEVERDWLEIFKREKELKEQYAKGDIYAANELSDLKKILSKPKKN